MHFFQRGQATKGTCFKSPSIRSERNSDIVPNCYRWSKLITLSLLALGLNLHCSHGAVAIGTLSPEEKEIARKVGFDKNVLLLIKETLHPEMGIVKYGNLENSDLSFLSVPDATNGGLREQDRLNYEKIAKRYPELKSVVEQQLNHYNNSSPLRDSNTGALICKEVGDQNFKRYQRYIKTLSKCAPLILQDLIEARDKTQQWSSGGPPIIIFNPKAKPFIAVDHRSNVFNSDAAVSEKIAQLRKRFADKILKDENRAVLTLGLRFTGGGESASAPDNRLADLNSKLELLGYRISEEQSSLASKQFTNRAAAEQYNIASGAKKEAPSFVEQQPLSYKAIFPIKFKTDLQNDDDIKTIVFQTRPTSGSAKDVDIAPIKSELKLKGPESIEASYILGLQIEPGATVKRTGDRRWLIHQPARFTVEAVQRTATVIKVPANSSSFELLHIRQTNGANCRLTTETIVTKLREWDTKYGVTVIDAKSNSSTVRFKNLPEDLSELCTEIFLLCPACELNDDENSNASKIRAKAARLRRDHTTSFYWDD